MQNYQLLNNSYSHDALPGLKSARKQRLGNSVIRVKVDETMFWGKRILKGEWRGVILGVLMGLLMALLMSVWSKEGGLESVIGRVTEVREIMGNLTGRNHLEVEL